MSDIEFSDYESRNISIKADDGNIISIGQGIENIDIRIEGSNNEIVLDDPIRCAEKLKIWVRGQYNKIHIAKKCNIRNLYIEQFGVGNLIEISESCSFMDVKLVCFETSEFVMKPNCMLSYGVVIRTSDTHSILDASTSKRLNFCKSIEIGEHCWIGENAYILKGASLADNMIVGAASVVTKPFTEGKAVIAGNPAHVIRKNVKWEIALIYN